MKISTPKELIAYLQTLPEYATICVSVTDSDGEGVEYRDLDPEILENDEAEKIALVSLCVA
jgi:hypothetical protein